MRKVREILRLKNEVKLSHREVAESLGVSIGVVSKVANRAALAGLSWGAAVELGEEEVEERLYGPRGSPGRVRTRPDPEWIHTERKRPGVTLELLHLEYLGEQPAGYRYTQFCEIYRQWLSARRVTMRQVHRDCRRRPQIDTASVWLCCFAMFAVRLKSFNAVEQELRRPKRWERFVGQRRPSADTISRVCCVFSLDSLRRVLVTLNRQAWRAKTVQRRPGELYRVVAVDGHELRASQARCCNQCLIRNLKLGERTDREYYHRVVVAQWVGVTPPGLLDVELIRPGEGEVVAARRLLERIFKAYGRLIDVVCGDAIYLKAPFCRTVLDAHKHFVVVMKQEARELYQDADRLRMLSTPQQVIDGAKTSSLWDLSNLSSFTTLGHQVRVVWAEETTTKQKIVGGVKETVVQADTWIWVTRPSRHLRTRHQDRPLGA